MKKFCILAILLCTICIGCSEKKQASEAERRQIFQIDSVDVQTGVQRMQVSKIEQDIQCYGKKFKLFIERTPCDTIPSVKSDMGVFADNKIVVSLTSENGKKIFSKMFTKNTFASHLSSQFLTRSILEGIVLDDVRTAEDKKITLAASVSFPMTDLYVPFSIIISKEGNMSLIKDENMGTLPPDESLD